MTGSGGRIACCVVALVALAACGRGGSDGGTVGDRGFDVVDTLSGAHVAHLAGVLVAFSDDSGDFLLGNGHWVYQPATSAATPSRT